MKGFSNSAVALVLLAVAGAASADALSDCYKTADNRVQVRQCLQKELDRTQRDYADTLAAVKDQAKQLDQASGDSGKKSRTAGPVFRDFAEANKAFDLYLRRQCGFESAMSGSGTSAGNQYIACRINLMKLRMGALGNFSGPASPDPSGK